MNDHQYRKDAIDYESHCAFFFTDFFTHSIMNAFLCISHLRLNQFTICTFLLQKPRGLNTHYHLYDHDCDTPSGDCDDTVFISEWVERWVTKMTFSLSLISYLRYLRGIVLFTFILEIYNLYRVLPSFVVNL